MDAPERMLPPHRKGCVVVTPEGVRCCYPQCRSVVRLRSLLVAVVDLRHLGLEPVDRHCPGVFLLSQNLEIRDAGYSLLVVDFVAQGFRSPAHDVHEAEDAKCRAAGLREKLPSLTPQLPVARRRV